MMNTCLSRSRLLSLVALAGLLAVAAVQSGCRGCSDKPKEPTGASTAPTGATGLPTAATPSELPADTTLVEPKYLGPSSETLDGWRITTGFANAEGKAVSAPAAYEQTKIYVTVLDPENRPIGKFDKLERGDMHGFLVARDLRQALYASANGSIREGADARELSFKPGEGGDHALIVVFRPIGGKPKVVSSPVTIKGALPEVMGPGVVGMAQKAEAGQDKLLLTPTPAQPIVGQPVTLLVQDMDEKGATRSEIKLPFVVVLNDQLGIGEVVEWDAAGKAVWTPRKAGDYLVLAPPTNGAKALPFKLNVIAPPVPAKP
jgi:hypothetical protein